MHGLYLVWWVQEKHVSAPVVAALLAAGDLAIAVLEIPTGWLADRFGHRASLITGSLAQLAGMLMCWLGTGVPGLLSAILLVAVGDTFRSGADQALLYRSCAALGREAHFQRLESRSRALQLTALVCLVLAGGVIVERWGFAAGWTAEAVVAAAGLAIALAMREPPSTLRDAHGDEDTGRAPIAERLSLTGGLLMAIVPASILAALSGAVAFVVQTAPGVHPSRMSAIVAAITFAEAIGSGVAAKATGGARLQTMLAALGLGGTMLALVHPAAVMPIAIGLSLLAGFTAPVRAALIQRAAADHVRARAASIASACDKILATVALVAAGQRQRSRRTR